MSSWQISTSSCSVSECMRTKCRRGAVFSAAEAPVMLDGDSRATGHAGRAAGAALGPILLHFATLLQLLAQEGSAGSFASPPRDFQSGPAGAGGGPAHEAIRPRSCAPALPRRCRSIDLLRKCLCSLQARLDEVSVADALKVVCAQQVQAPLLPLQQSAQKPFDIRSLACGVPTRHCASALGKEA